MLLHFDTLISKVLFLFFNNFAYIRNGRCIVVRIELAFETQASLDYRTLCLFKGVRFSPKVTVGLLRPGTLFH